MKKLLAGSKPSSSLVAATSSAPSLEPCTAPVFCFGGCRVADDGAQLNEGGLVGDSLGTLNSGVQFCDVLNVVTSSGPVHALNIPTVGLVALCHVLGEGNVGVFLNGDVVAVPDDNQVAELLVTCERARLGGDAFLHVTFGGDDVDVVVEGEVPGAASGSNMPRIRRCA